MEVGKARVDPRVQKSQMQAVDYIVAVKDILLLTPAH